MENPQYFGCFANVLHIVSRKCSGRKECTIDVPDPDLERTSPCLEGLKMFLEVRYSCIEGTPTSNRLLDGLAQTHFIILSYFYGQRLLGTLLIISDSC